MQKGLAILAIICGLGLAIGTGKSMPDNAQIYVYENGKRYISPPCLAGRDFEHRDLINSQEKAQSLLILNTFSKIKEMNAGRGKSEKIHRDEICNNNSGYDESMTLIEKLTIGHSFISGNRWNEDGSWNW